MTRARSWLFVVVALLGGGLTAQAMSTYDDPRVVLSYMDKALTGERDILRVATSVLGDEYLIFEVKTRADEGGSGRDDYVLLEISQRRSHQFLIPIGAEFGAAVRIYEREPAPDGGSGGLEGSELKAGESEGGFTSRRVRHGVEFQVPLAWIDFREGISFDAFTVRGRSSGDTFRVEQVYDQAGKGRTAAAPFSPIMLLNNLCATRR